MRKPFDDGEHKVVEARCPNAPSTLHFKVIAGDLIEIKCNNRQCTGGGKTVVLHRYSFPELTVVETLRFADPEAVRARPLERKFRR